VARRISDGKVLDLIRSFLKSGVMEEMKVSYDTTGTPQGGIISPVLANIYLHDLDVAMETHRIAWGCGMPTMWWRCAKAGKKRNGRWEQIRQVLGRVGIEAERGKDPNRSSR
jgi:retron-type reverse transcriptase